MEAMSEDGGAVKGAARGLASRLRAAWSSVNSDPAGSRTAGESGAGYQNGRRPDRLDSGKGADPGKAEEPGTGAQSEKREEQDAGVPLADRRADSSVPPLLRNAASWCWRLLLVAAVAYLAFKVADALRLVVIPLIAALLLTALLQPLTGLLRRLGLPGLAATWLTVLAAVAVLVGIGTLIANRVQADYPRLASEVRSTVHEVQAYLAGPPFRLNNTRLDQLSNHLLTYLAQHKSVVAGTVLTGGRYFLEVLTGIILTVFITFFLLKDGRKIWSWMISALRPLAHRRAVMAGDAAWSALVGYIRGTTVVAAIHAIFIGLALWLLGVPLVVPLIMLVFLAAYLPLIGILVVGALAIVITLATKGVIAAIILLAVFLAENQIESHLLQPLVVGRIVRLHPLAIIVVLAVGGIVAGVPGAIIAVPVAAMITYAWPYLRGDHDHDPQVSSADVKAP
jgi:predicted PurR-regulated permease PerM